MFLLGMIPQTFTLIAKAPFSPSVDRFLSPGWQARSRSTAARTKGDMARNRETFGAAIATLKQRGAILIFPEGLSQAEPVLMPLRTGAARILLSAETAANGASV
jgi:hypothetical protein